jgi:cell division protease FtsH
VTTGASSDIEQATIMAKNMVTKWGLSDKLGPVFYGSDQSGKYYGSEQNDFSDEIARTIDAEVKRIVEEAKSKAESILKSKKDDLEKLAKNLLEYETLTGEEIRDLIAGNEIKKNIASENVISQESLIPKIAEVMRPAKDF